MPYIFIAVGRCSKRQKEGVERNAPEGAWFGQARPPEGTCQDEGSTPGYGTYLCILKFETIYKYISSGYFVPTKV